MWYVIIYRDTEYEKVPVRNTIYKYTLVIETIK